MGDYLPRGVDIELDDLMRRAVDRDPAPGRFLLAGSASASTPPTHSGAGRIVTVRMRPMSLVKRGITRPTVSLTRILRGDGAGMEGRTNVTLADYVSEIVTSGFPGIRRFSGRGLRA